MSGEATVPTPGALAGLRVLDLAGPFGNYCGKLFADMGADVILIEPPEGAPSRRRPPIGEWGTDEAQFTYLYENTSKRSLCLDLSQPSDRAILRQLVESADLFIETEKPGVLTGQGLGQADLRALNPALVYTSITGFGQTGPFADYECEDIVALALGGLLTLAGEPGRPPVAAYGFQAFGAAGLFAAVASLVAVMNAETTGRGEYIDVSMQECVAMGLENAAQFYDLEGVVRKRTGSRFARAGLGAFPCRDGLIFLMAAGVGANQFWFKTVDWLAENGVEGVDILRGGEWLDDAFLYTDEAKRQFSEIFEPFAKAHDAETLYAEGQRRRIPICPVRAPSDALDDAQLLARGFFVDAMGSGPPGMVLPGAPYRLSVTPWAMTRPAPGIGAHTAEILSELRDKACEPSRRST